MEAKRAYLNSDLSLTALAAQLSIPENYLSQVINQHFRMSFNDYVNNYRIEEAKKRLVDPSARHLTIEAIAGEAGFKSMAVFYRAFRKHAHASPPEFIQASKE